MIKLMKDHSFFANKIVAAKVDAAHENKAHQMRQARWPFLMLPNFNMNAAIKRKLREFGGNNKYVPH